jgi:intracellular sulfur oxidation DsrE/DsrF family protein
MTLALLLRRIACGLAILSLVTGAAFAQAQALIEGYGNSVAVENAGELPDPALDYKVVLSVTERWPEDEPAFGLDTAATLLNLLAQSGVPAEHRHIVLVMHGDATLSVLNEAGLKAHDMTDNPSAALIAKLAKAGVSIRLCGQAMAAAGVTREELLPEIQVDLSAVTTLATLQMRGYALLPD